MARLLIKSHSIQTACQRPHGYSASGGRGRNAGHRIWELCLACYSHPAADLALPRREIQDSKAPIPAPTKDSPSRQALHRRHSCQSRLSMRAAPGQSQGVCPDLQDDAWLMQHAGHVENR